MTPPHCPLCPQCRWPCPIWSLSYWSHLASFRAVLNQFQIAPVLYLSAFPRFRSKHQRVLPLAPPSKLLFTPKVHSPGTHSWNNLKAVLWISFEICKHCHYLFTAKPEGTSGGVSRVLHPATLLEHLGSNKIASICCSTKKRKFRAWEEECRVGGTSNNIFSLSVRPGV